MTFDPKFEALGNSVLTTARVMGCDPSLLWIRISRWMKRNHREPEIPLIMTMAARQRIDELRQTPGYSRRLGKIFSVISLDAPQYEGSPDTILERLEEEKPPISPEMRQHLGLALEVLDPRHLAVILAWSEGRTFDEIGADFGVTGSRIQQMKVSAILRMRRIFYKLEGLTKLPKKS